jgi:hypothetical protein
VAEATALVFAHLAATLPPVAAKLLLTRRPFRYVANAMNKEFGRRAENSSNVMHPSGRSCSKRGLTEYPMGDFTTQLPTTALLFIVVFIINVIPAFAPPTWLTLSVIGFSSPDISVVLLALTGAAAATLGRLALAKLSRAIVRGRFLSEPIRENVNAVKVSLEKYRVFTFGMFLAYAFSHCLELPFHSLRAHNPRAAVSGLAVLHRSARQL